MTAPLYQHVLADSVAPRIKTLAADWQVWEFAEGATHIEYDGEYGSERVWIVSGRATIEPNDGSPSFNVGPGDVVYFLRAASNAPGAFTRPLSCSGMASLVLMGGHMRCVRLRLLRGELPVR